ncbi:MAG: hypothetical protein JO034_03865 [Singulisphaera sp.]|nr:hypothetical protein [Singulisphaera sp.]
MNHAGSGVILMTLEALNLSGRSLATLEADRQVTDFRGAVQKAARRQDLVRNQGEQEASSGQGRCGSKS